MRISLSLSLQLRRRGTFLALVSLTKFIKSDCIIIWLSIFSLYHVLSATYELVYALHYRKTIDPDATMLVHTHLWLNQPVAPGGVLSVVDIFLHTPIELEENNPPLWFLVSNLPSKREAMEGRWKRLRSEVTLSNVHIWVQVEQRNLTKVNVHDDWVYEE